MEKYYEMDKLITMSDDKIEKLKIDLKNSIAFLEKRASELMKQAKVDHYGMNACFLFSSSDYQESLEATKMANFMKRELEILEIYKFKNLLTNSYALKVFEKYAYDYNDINLLISIFTNDEIINNQELLQFINDNAFNYELLTNKYLCNHLNSLKSVVNKSKSIVNKTIANHVEKQIIDICSIPAIVNNQELLDLLLEHTRILWGNQFLFTNEAIINNKNLFSKIVSELKWYCENKDCYINEKNSDKLKKLKYLEKIFNSTEPKTDKCYDEIDPITTVYIQYSELSVQLIEKSLAYDSLKNDTDLLFSALSPYSFIRAINNRKKEKQKIYDLQKVVNKLIEQANNCYCNEDFTYTVTAIHQLLNQIAPIETEEKSPDLRLANMLHDTNLKRINMDQFYKLVYNLELIDEIYPELISNTLNILERNPILKTNISYIYALLLKKNIKEQNIFEKYMQIDEVRENFTYNGGDSIYGFLLSLGNNETIKENLNDGVIELYVSKKSDKGETEFIDVFAHEGLKNIYEYDSQSDSIKYVTVEDVYRHAINKYIMFFDSPEAELEHFSGFRKVEELQGDVLKNAFIKYVVHLDHVEELGYFILLDTLMEIKFMPLEKGKNISNNKTYSNPNKYIMRKVKKITKPI